MEHIIWTSEININDWKDYIESELMNEYGTYNGSVDEFIEENYDKCYEKIVALNDDYLNDERLNLNVNTEGKIICIADLGFWNGRASGYSYEGNNIGGCLHSHVNGISDIKFYVEKVNKTFEFKATEWHHDGTNFYTYRELKPNLSDTQISNFESKLYEGNATRADINRYTKPLGEEIQKVYGFNFENAVKQVGKE